MKNYVRYDSATKEVIISGIPIGRLTNRIDETYRSTSGYKKVGGASIRNLFNSIDYITWDVAELRFYSYFSLEMYEMFNQLSEEYKDTSYADVAQQLYERTWISNYEKAEKIKIDTLPLLQFRIQPKDFQLEFIKEYPQKKFAYEFDGLILSFEQGLGKTFTSVAVAECLKKDIVYIVCPNAVKENWAYEIKSYFRKYENNEKLWHDEVYVSGVSGYKYTKNTKYIIINQESIPNIFKYVDSNKDSMIIIDESHNFRGLHTKRTEAMLKLKELANCHDCLLMSGTPIKAIASELAPAMRMIDPHFTPELAELYCKTFSDASPEASNVVKARFKRVIYRKLKRDTLKLPDRFVSDMRLKIPHPERYHIRKFKDEVLNEFHKEYSTRLRNGLFTNNPHSIFYRKTAGSYNFLKAEQEFEAVVRKYSRAHSQITDNYLDMIFQRSEDNNWELVTAQNVEKKYYDFLMKYVVPYVKTAEEKDIVTKRFDGIFGWALAAKSSASTVIGRLISKYKNDCFSEMWKYNYQEIIDMIQKNKKKTIIFTALVPVANYIAEDLNKKGVETVKIIGATSDKMGLMNEFKNNDSVKCLVATTETLANGVTLVEANQMFFFGTPYRNADFEQACDRMHRIGQTENCYIYNVLLWSIDKNITDRIQEILNWSDEMFDSLINEEWKYY